MLSDLQETVLDLAWSLWAALGVPGWKQTRHEKIAIDPEPLILFTAGLQSLDSRLYSEAYEWCRAHREVLSNVRLGHLRDSTTELAGPATDRFLLALGVVPRKGSRTRTHNLAVATRGRLYDVQAFDRPSQIALRLRALFGVSARAEIVRMLLAYPQSVFSAPELALQVNYVRRNVARALESLLRGGLVKALTDRNTVRFALARPHELRDFVGAEPDRYPAWTQVLEFAAGLLAMDAEADRIASISLAVRATRFLDAHASLIELHRLPPPPRIGASEVWPTVRPWAVATLRLIADNEGKVLETPAVPPVLAKRRPPRKLKASQPRRVRRSS